MSKATRSFAEHGAALSHGDARATMHASSGTERPGTITVSCLPPSPPTPSPQPGGHRPNRRVGYYRFGSCRDEPGRIARQGRPVPGVSPRSSGRRGFNAATAQWRSAQSPASVSVVAARVRGIVHHLARRRQRCNAAPTISAQLPRAAANIIPARRQPCRRAGLAQDYGYPGRCVREETGRRTPCTDVCPASRQRT